jgi:hypothetical protein
MNIPKHVNALTKRTKLKGEIDPVLVIKLAAQPWEVDDVWIVVDGHHRLAAYKKAKHTGTICCQWFGGSARAAMDASAHRNDKVHLPIEQGDRYETAWTRTLLSWDGKTWSSSKEQVVKLTGCSEGMVAAMRRVVKWHHNYRTGADEHPMGERLFTRLGDDLSGHTWSK